jgi:hypothetical protein
LLCARFHKQFRVVWPRTANVKPLLRIVPIPQETAHVGSL